MKLVSVIIPVYNVEKHLKRCLRSVLNQTYQNLEIILVDDGSTDTCPRLLDTYAKKDGRIKVLHKTNEGVSVARNVGLEMATGDYVCFVDSDDFLPKRSIEVLYEGLTQNDADLSIGCWARITPKSTYYNRRKAGLIPKMDKHAFMEIMNAPEMKGPVAKLFKKSLLQEKKLRFPKGVVISEDTLFVYEYLKACNTVYAVDENVYYYNKLSIGSATTKFYDRFHEVAFACVKAFADNVAKNEEDMRDILLQEKIVGDFMAVRGYFSHFLDEDKARAESMLKETYALFCPLIFTDVLKGSEKDFSAFLTVWEECENGEFVLPATRKNQPSKFKRALLSILVKLKTIWIFACNGGYRD